MKKRILFLTLLAVVTVTALAQQKYPWQNPQLSTVERVENLISMLTPEEKVGLMMNKSISIDRFGIPSYNWWSEACHGVRQGGYTVFPQPIGMAAAFSEKLVFDVFSAVSDEAAPTGTVPTIKTPSCSMCPWVSSTTLATPSSPSGVRM